MADQLDQGVANDGTLNINANAYASGVAGIANANADLGAGIVQIGFLRFTAAAHVTNSGAMNIGAHATANAYDTANANAHVGFGIVQVGDSRARIGGCVQHRRRSPRDHRVG